MHAGGNVIDDVTWQRLPQETCRGVLEIDPFEIALSLEYGKRTHGSKRRATDMTHDGVGNIAAAISAKPSPVREVHVFMRRKEILVEPAQFLEHRLRHHARRTADAKDLLRDERRRRGLTMMTFERPAPTQH